MQNNRKIYLSLCVLFFSISLALWEYTGIKTGLNDSNTIIAETNIVPVPVYEETPNHSNSGEVTAEDKGSKRSVKVYTQQEREESRNVNTNLSKQPVVVIDAGHGGYDPGAIGPRGTAEKDNVLSVALKVGRILEQRNIKVVYTRKNDNVSWPSNNRMDLEARAAISNNAGADVFISIHNNSSDYKSVRGTETYYTEGSTQGKVLATLIHNQIIKDLKTVDRQVRPSDYFVLKNTYAPAVLIELGFISNSHEELLLSSASGQEKFAKAIADGILRYFQE
jgi:N-acetylmuramoyl-L-alanine amidase